ncbi:MAG TPA: NAD(P)H-binding protein [Candidatus Dormibacteraeota bacterium]|nr:NAD(P)H-binding protein [Candidatus Dormibacteraeota bacterium]
MQEPQQAPIDAVTGAFSYTGRFIARRLLADGRRVRTLTNHSHRPGAEDLEAAVEVEPLSFDDRSRLITSLRGVDVLYNTYWVRFPYGGLDFDLAVANTRILISAAEAAGVRKFVQISVSNPAADSPLPYYAGKARAEQLVRDSALRWAIVRPTLVFGSGDILINNIAWMLRHMPLFGIPGLGHYRLQPVDIEDVADIAVDTARHEENVTVDAAGPEILTYTELVDQIAIAVRRRPPYVYLPPSLVILAGRVMGLAVRDVILTAEEVKGLMMELLVSDEAPQGTRRFDDWLLRVADTIGRSYASELDRHFRVPRTITQTGPRPARP